MADLFRFSDGMPKKDDKNVIENAFRRLRAASREAIHDLLAGGFAGFTLLWLLPGWVSSWVMLTVTILFLSSVIGPFVSYLRPKKTISTRNKSILITGCDSGFGNLLALKMDDAGFQVFACCLFPDGEGAKKLKQSGSSRIHIVGMDVCKDEDVQNALDYVKENLGTNKLWAIVCNAGLHDGGEVLWTSTDTIKKVVDVNFLGTVRVTKAFLPLICRSKGRVVATASASGRFSFGGMAPYCSSKSAVITFCDCLRAEMYKLGVKVVTIEPWLYRTRVLDKKLTMDIIKKSWEGASEEEKSFYPHDYLDVFSAQARKFLDQDTSDNINDVIMCMREAIVAEHPKYCYSPGKIKLRMRFWLLKKLPQPVYDWLVVGSVVSARK